MRKLLSKLPVWASRRPRNLLAQPGTLEKLHEDPACCLLVRPGDGPDCIVSFTGVGHAMGGIDVQRPEFVKLGGSGPTVFVVDKQRSWGNALDPAAISDRIRARVGPRPIHTIGNSMGGFLAILLSGPLAARSTIAFTPQWSIDPRIVPEETRWMDYRTAIPSLRFPDLSGAFSPGTDYVLVFGSGTGERYHAGFFPQAANIRTFRVVDASHDVAAHLKHAGCLYELLEACLTGGDPGAQLARRGIRLSGPAGLAAAL